MLRRLLRRPEAPAQPTWGFVGDYPSFEAAEALATGYEVEAYATTAANGLRTLIDAPAYTVLDERFMQVHSALAYISQAENLSSLSVLDYGGGTGVYAKVMRQLMPSTAFDWSVLESAPVVAACQDIAGSPARFISELPSAPVDVAIISGTLQYLREPWAVLDQVAKIARWIILTRLPVVDGPEDRVTLQIVSPSLSMPVWLLSEKKLRESLGSRIVLEWVVTPDVGLCAMANTAPKGFLIYNQTL